MSNKKPLNRWLVFRLVLTIILIIFIASRLDLKSIPHEILKIDLIPYGFAMIIFTCLILISAIHNLIVLRSINVKYRLLHILKINYFSFFFSLFSMIVGGVARFVSLSGSEGRRGEAAFMMLVERVQQIVVLCISIIGIILWNPQDSNLNTRYQPAFIATLALMPIVLLGFHFLIMQTPDENNLISRNLMKNRFLSFLIKGWNDLSRVNRSFSGNVGAVVSSIAVSFVGVVFGCIFFNYIFKAFHIHLEVSMLVYVYSLVTLIQLIPITIYGMGVREGALIFLLRDYAPSAEQSTLIGLSMFLPCILHGLIGGVWFIIFPKSKN